MFKQEKGQLELFSGGQGQFEARVEPKPRSLFNLRGYEKLVLWLLALVTVGVVSFALGVQRGREAVPQAVRARVILAQPPAPSAARQAQPPAVIPARTDKPQAAAPVGLYDIQLASYSSRAAAESEAVQLKARGYNAFVSAKGRYSVLYVGKFPTREAAQGALAQLKKRFKDCVIRRN